MPLKSPNLDDRTFADLREEAVRLIAERAPGWTDRSASDPGMTLVEVFAYLTEILVYRLNRLPEKVHVALLDLLGVAPLGPAAAEATLTFEQPPAAAGGRGAPATVVPAGTLVTDRTGAVVFATSAEVTVPAQDDPTQPERAEVLAVHAERVEGELLGRSSGEAAQSFTVRRGPLLRRPLDPQAIVVGVETGDTDMPEATENQSFEGRAFAVWREVPTFAGCGPRDLVYTVDRAAGRILFAPLDGAPAPAPPIPGAPGGAPEKPHTLGATPAKGREIRAWYLRGGGRAGNVAPNILTTIKTPLGGLTVTNAAQATGGEDLETTERALVRGREAVRVLRSAVTAGDFERVAQEVPGIARARAYAQVEVWSFGRPGTVDVLVVPEIDVAGCPDGITPAVLARYQTPLLLATVDQLVRRRRPLGIETRLDWVRCRPVDVSARVVLTALERKDAVRDRLVSRIHRLLAPNGSWPFGRPLRASDIYETLLSEPGFRFAENVTFTIADAPKEKIVSLRRDTTRPEIFYAAGRNLYRSLDAGDSWVTVLERPGETVLGVRTTRELPGSLAAFTAPLDPAVKNWVVTVSSDGGETWNNPRADWGNPEKRLLGAGFPFEIIDVAWTVRDGVPILFVAGRDKLHCVRLGSEISTEPVPVRGTTDANQKDDTRGFRGVSVARHVSGLEFVAVAAREMLGVFVAAGGQPFRLLPGTERKDIRAFGFHQHGNETFLWVGLAAEQGAPGEGAMRIAMRIDGSYDPTGWEKFSAGWGSGSCEVIDVWGDTVMAASNRGGVLQWTLGTDKAWSAPPTLECGLPLIDARRSFAPVAAMASGQDGNGAPVLLAGGAGGTFRSRDGGRSYKANGRTQFEDRVPLPRNWLFCSGTITLDVAVESGGEG